MTTGEMAHRYALADSVAASVVPYESCIYNDQLLRIVSYGEEGERALDRIYAGTDLLVEVHFYVEYQPGNLLSGSSNTGTGLTAVYILVPTNTTQPCEVISGWYSSQIGEKMPRPGQTLMAEGLTIYQSRMLLHQCRAMAAAGAAGIYLTCRLDRGGTLSVSVLPGVRILASRRIPGRMP